MAPRARPIHRLWAIATVALSLALSLSACADSGNVQTTLRILIHSNPPTNAAVTALNQEFERKYPNIKIELTTVPTNDFARARNSRVAAGTADITEGASSGLGTQPSPAYVTGPQPDFVTGVRAGNWVDLSDQPFLKNFSPDVLRQVVTDGKQYAVPSGGVLYTGVFYNKTLFASAGLTSVPTTWPQFQDAVRKLRAANITPLVIGGKDIWPAGLPLLAVVQSLFPDVSAMQAFDQGLWQKTARLTDPISVQVLERVKEIYASADPTFPGVSEDQASAKFASGTVAMWPDGTWNAAAIDKANPNLQYGYFPLPAGDSPAGNTRLAGKLDFSFAIPTSSAHRTEALQWLAFYADPDNYRTFARMTGFIPIQPDISTTPFNDSLKPYLAPGGISPAWDQTFHPNARSGDLSRHPWAFPSIAPMGRESDMTALAQQMQENWVASLSG
jgi:raffinose/stachyose/melibiose transport system substrate-binding protein